MPIIVVTGKEIEKIKGDYESYLSGLNMVGKIDYSQYSQLYDEGTKHIQRAYELGKSELEKENAELKEQCSILADCNTCVSDCKTENIEIKTQLTKAKEIIKELLSSCFGYNSKTVNYEVRAKAESFLKECK